MKARISFSAHSGLGIIVEAETPDEQAILATIDDQAMRLGKLVQSSASFQAGGGVKSIGLWPYKAPDPEKAAS